MSSFCSGAGLSASGPRPFPGQGTVPLQRPLRACYASEFAGESPSPAVQPASQRSQTAPCRRPVEPERLSRPDRALFLLKMPKSGLATVSFVCFAPAGLPPGFLAARRRRKGAAAGGRSSAGAPAPTRSRQIPPHQQELLRSLKRSIPCTRRDRPAADFFQVARRVPVCV